MLGDPDEAQVSKPSARRKGVHPVILRLKEEDFGRLSSLASDWGLRRSELVRRLIRAAADTGPALSAENSQTVVALSSQLRGVGRALGQVLHAVNSGHAVGIEALAPTIVSLTTTVRRVDEALSAITVAYGLKLRRVARERSGAAP